MSALINPTIQLGAQKRWLKINKITKKSKYYPGYEEALRKGKIDDVGRNYHKVELQIFSKSSGLFSKGNFHGRTEEKFYANEGESALSQQTSLQSI